MTTYILGNIGDKWPFQVDFDVEHIIESEDRRDSVEISIVFVLEQSHVSFQVSYFCSQRLSSEKGK